MGHRPRHAAPRRAAPLPSAPRHLAPCHAASRRVLPGARRVAALVGTTLVTCFAATGLVGTAYAVWTAGGAGTSTVAAGTAQPLTASSVAVPATLLYPGATADATLVVDNPNPYAVTVTAIRAGTITSDGGPACDASTGVSFADQSGSWSVPALGSRTVTLVGAVAMSNASADACQGAVFTVPVTLAATSS